MKPIGEQTIVITGATSGIGLVTARMAARQGARVVAAGRSADALQHLEQEFGSEQLIGVVCDVTREEDLQRVAQTAIERFGGFDTWVNNAGVSVYGEILKVPVEDERRIFEVNYWGAVMGSRIAARHLKGRGGAIINVGSVASDRSIPLQAAYSASKHALRAYTDALRVELEHEKAPVSVTLIKPTSIDTPFFRHAANYLDDAAPSAPAPVYAPDLVAKAILYAAQHRVREMPVGDAALISSAMGRLTPRLGDHYMRMTAFSQQRDTRPVRPGENRSLEGPSGDLRERGGYGWHTLESSMYNKAATNPLLSGALALGAGLALYAWLRPRPGRGHRERDAGEQVVNEEAVFEWEAQTPSEITS